MDQISANRSNNILSIRRLKSKYSSIISPVIIELKDIREKNQVLRIAYLYRTEIPGIFFNEDLTYQEQIKAKKLREENKLLNKDLDFNTPRKQINY